VKIGALIPIRLDSTRLPNKALQDVAGLPAVQRLITQVAACDHVSRQNIIICTTERPQDDPLTAVCTSLGVGLFRGSTDDLIDRLYRAADANHFEVILQVDGDDICADPDYMERCLAAVLQGKAEVAVCGPGLPLGAAAKAITARCLKTIFHSYVPGKNDTGFGYYLTRSGLFRVAAIDPIGPQDVMPELRLTLDYEQDLELFRAIYRNLRGARDEALRVAQICALARAQPQLMQINAGLDEAYWERTREIMARHPLQLRIGADTVQLDTQ
jgi:spore coat polysaccharide biosynthesis protein SpsF (cytidylyltransferase family)